MLALLCSSGCWMSVEDHCPRCTIVSERAPSLPALPPSTRALVILVHGAFGFGSEWREVVAHTRARKRVAMLAFAWGGPWTRKPSLAAEALRRLVQEAVDSAPPRAEIVVIAHSAGGALVSYIAERLRVPPNARRVRIVSIAAPDGMNLAPYRPDTTVDTPLGFAVGGEQPPLGPVAAGVDYVEYATEDPPRRPLPSRAGARRVWLGARVGHLESVPLVALPIVGAL
jgi:hypothetical protein